VSAVEVDALVKTLERQDDSWGRLQRGEEVDRREHVARRRRARADDAQLGAQHPLEIDRHRLEARSEDEQRAARRERCEGLVDAGGRAEDGRVDMAVERAGAERARELHAFRYRVGGEHLVTAPSEYLHPQEADEAAADDEHTAARQDFGAPQDTGQRLGKGADDVVDRSWDLDPIPGARSLGEAARLDRRAPELFAGRFVSGPAALALAAREMMDESNAPAVVKLGHDLVPEHRPGRHTTDLLDVCTAQPACPYPDEISLALGPRNPLQLGRSALIKDDRTHRYTLGARGYSSAGRAPGSHPGGRRFESG